MTDQNYKRKNTRQLSLWGGGGGGGGGDGEGQNEQQRQQSANHRWSQRRPIDPSKATCLSVILLLDCPQIQ